MNASPLVATCLVIGYIMLPWAKYLWIILLYNYFKPNTNLNTFLNKKYYGWMCIWNKWFIIIFVIIIGIHSGSMKPLITPIINWLLWLPHSSIQDRKIFPCFNRFYGLWLWPVPLSHSQQGAALRRRYKGVTFAP